MILCVFQCCVLSGCSTDSVADNVVAGTSRIENSTEDSTRAIEVTSQMGSGAQNSSSSIYDITVEKLDSGNDDTNVSAIDDTTEAEENDTTYEYKIKELYLTQKETEELIRTIILTNLEKASYIQYASANETGTDYRKAITDAIIDDAVDGPILSEAAKAAVDSLWEKKSVDDIITDTTSALIDGTEDYITSAAKSAVLGEAEQYLDLIPFDTVNWINEFINVDDTPVGLLNGMIDMQKADVDAVLSIVGKEEFGPGELRYVAGVYKRISSRQDEIISAGGKTSALGQIEEIESCVEKWEKTSGAIYGLSKLMKSDGNQNESTELDRGFLFKYVSDSIMGLPCNYDVKAYREEQKYTEQSGMASGKLFGDLLGNMANSDLENNQKTAQENRISFYKTLESSLDDSYYKMCVARGFLDELYYAEDNDFVLNQAIIPDDDIRGALYSYLGYAYGYALDLRTATMLWKIITSEYDSSFTSELEKNLADQFQIVQNGLDDGFATVGYESDEEINRYVAMIDAYAQYLNYSMIYSSYETQYGLGAHSVTAYGVGTFDVYLKGKTDTPIILAEEQMNTNYHKAKYLWVYDAEGNPIYVDNQFGKTYVMNGGMVMFTGTSDDIGFKIKNNADRIAEDVMSGNIAHGYKEYVME
ncbi:MAG: hypothetical protein J6O61_03095 [Butyrivibrio sp.]|uniref:hypothetical protein n=1 Tax=Butyrivibrio sp. TaxID=28121 RepID=UPI001B206CF7|nr:hypothetical protein [Butyrivibrio sp.]MBO6239815.1 hypothetical protein [Butyrivibrio sp.]